MGPVMFRGAEVSCPNIFSIACRKMCFFQVFLPEYYMFFCLKMAIYINSRGRGGGGMQPPSPPPPPPRMPMVGPTVFPKEQLACFNWAKTKQNKIIFKTLLIDIKKAWRPDELIDDGVMGVKFWKKWISCFFKSKLLDFIRCNNCLEWTIWNEIDLTIWMVSWSQGIRLHKGAKLSIFSIIEKAEFLKWLSAVSRTYVYRVAWCGCSESPKFIKYTRMFQILISTRDSSFCKGISKLMKSTFVIVLLGSLPLSCHDNHCMVVTWCELILPICSGYTRVSLFCLHGNERYMYVLTYFSVVLLYCSIYWIESYGEFWR